MQGANSGFGRSAQTEGVLEYGAIWHAIVIDCQIQDKALDISLLFILPTMFCCEMERILRNTFIAIGVDDSAHTQLY